MIERRLADPHRVLLRALGERLPGLAIDRSSSVPWASVTFTGARHCVAGTIAAPDAAAFAAGADAIEFALPGHIVADIAVAVSGAGDATRIEIEALTIEDR